MGSAERSKKKVQLWKKAIVHFSLCFVMGFFTGFAPTGKSSIFSTANKTEQPIEMLHQPTSIAETPETVATMSKDLQPTKLLKEEEEEEEEEKYQELNLVPRRSLIVVTPMSSKNRYWERYGAVFLRRLANTIRLVAPPILWIVVEGQSESGEVSEILRKTGIMSRHLVLKENFTDAEAEMEHQRNLALRHIEQHRLSGIVHFAGLSNVYDLGFWAELREIEVFGTWAMALLSANKKKVRIEGPVCDSSQVLGWHLKKMNNTNTRSSPPIHISSFAFNSSILWDPEIWGRPSSGQATSQNSIKFVKQVVLEDETKLKGIPPQDCSKIMLWHLRFPTASPPTTHLLAPAPDATSDR